MQRIVKPLVNGRVLASIAIFSVAFAILMFGLFYWLAFSDVLRGMGFPGLLFQVFLLASGVLFVLLAIWSTWGAWFYLRLERRRQAAADDNGAHHFPATEQPSPHAIPLSLPVIIRMRAKWPIKLLAWLSVALFALIASAGEAVDHGVWDNPGFFLMLLGALCTGSFFALVCTGERQIQVTHDHLTVHVGILARIAVPWEEARLFAITRGRCANLTYELASSQASINWVWVRPGTFSTHLFEPTIPHYEYDYQMESLLGLITAKTGLPLCDLR